MRKILILLFVVSFVACTKDYNSDLRGRWQLRSEKSGATEWKVDTLFYSFDNHVVSVQKKAYLNYGLIFGHFAQTGDSLFLAYPDVNKSALKSFGIKDSSDHYKIDKLDADALILTSKSRQLVFRKF